jgi:hypothetical protein
LEIPILLVLGCVCVCVGGYLHRQETRCLFSKQSPAKEPQPFSKHLRMKGSLPLVGPAWRPEWRAAPRRHVCLCDGQSGGCSCTCRTVAFGCAWRGQQPLRASDACSRAPNARGDVDRPRWRGALMQRLASECHRYNVAEVVALLKAIGMLEVAAVEANGLGGGDLLDLSLSEMLEDLGLGKLQAKKLRVVQVGGLPPVQTWFCGVGPCISWRARASARRRRPSQEWVLTHGCGPSILLCVPSRNDCFLFKLNSPGQGGGGSRCLLLRSAVDCRAAHEWRPGRGDDRSPLDSQRSAPARKLGTCSRRCCVPRRCS